MSLLPEARQSTSAHGLHKRGFRAGQKVRRMMRRRASLREILMALGGEAGRAKSRK